MRRTILVLGCFLAEFLRLFTKRSPLPESIECEPTRGTGNPHFSLSSGEDTTLCLRLILPRDDGHKVAPALVRGQDVAALASVPDLVVWLQSIESELTARGKRSDFERVFQNQSLLSAQELLSQEGLGGEKNPFLVFVRIQPSDGWAQLAMFKAFFLYLEGRYEQLDAEIALVYCAWQRYNLIKSLWATHSSADGEIAWSVAYEFASAYRALVALLEQDSFAYAFHVLWCYAGSPEGNLAYALIRERMRLSMVLDFDQSGDDSPAKPENRDPGTLHSAPLCFEEGLSWKRVRLHNRFCDRNGRAAVVHLVRDWLLPRYALDEATRLSWLLTGGLKCPLWLLGGGAMSLWLAAMFAFLVVGWYRPSVSLDPVVAFGLQFLPLLTLALMLWGLDKKTWMSLTLPRLCGGTFIGYLPLILAEEPWRLARIFGFKLQTLVLWVISISLTWIYLWSESTRWAGDRMVSKKRAVRVLIWALMVSLWAGVWFVQLGQPIYGSACVSFDPSLQGCLNQIALPAVVTFVPMALLIGLLTQILWEEKPVTAPVSPNE